MRLIVGLSVIGAGRRNRGEDVHDDLPDDDGCAGGSRRHRGLAERDEEEPVVVVGLHRAGPRAETSHWCLPHARAACARRGLRAHRMPGTGEHAFGGDRRRGGEAEHLRVGATLGYDTDNLMTEAGAETITRDPQNGRVQGTTLGGVTDTYGYDPNGALASYVAQYGGTTVYAETIVRRDGDGRILEKTDAVGAVSHDWVYQYDTAGRLTDVSEDGVAESHYEYDVDDNRLGSSLALRPRYLVLVCSFRQLSKL